MPKIIENIRRQLLDTAREQINRHGYENTTIRSVAGECGVGVGTVYNYFPSKDMLIATFMLEDWQECLARMAEAPTDAEELLFHMYTALREFSDQHSALFRDADAAKVFVSAFTEKHKLLRTQLAEVVRPICHRDTAKDQAFLAEFIAESLLSWTMAGEDFARFSPVLLKLL